MEKSTSAASANGGQPLKESSFSLSHLAAWLIIAALWSITPLCYLYVLWTLITLAPALLPYRPASQGALRVLHYIVLSYCALEIPFSVYYRYLAIRANAFRPTPQYTRKFLRSVFKRSLENGLDTEGEDPLGALSLLEVPKERGSEVEEGMEGEAEEDVLRRESDLEKGSVKVELQREGQLHPSRVASDDSDLGTIQASTATLVQGTSSSIHFHPKKYVPSFLKAHPLTHDDPRAQDFRNTIKLWFLHCKSFEQIKRGNMCDWVAWSIYGVSYYSLVEERKVWEKEGRPPLSLEGELDLDEDGLEIEGGRLGFIEHCVDMVEARAAHTFELGRTRSIKVIRLTLDPVKVQSRPLFLYVLVWIVQKFVVGQSKRRGFKEVVDDDIRYLVRIPTGWKPDRNGPESKRPLLFLHGLGMGVAQYNTILGYMATSEKLKDRPLVVLIQPHISMAFFAKGYLHPPDMETQTAGLMRIVKKWGFDKSGLTVLSHSNGSIVHSWLLKSQPNLVVRSCFVDPVCFCLWEPFVCFNFLYRKAKSSLDYLMRYLVSRELGVALVLQRAFNWSSNLLFPSQIPNLSSPYHSAFFLASQDSIVNSERVRRYLRRAGVKEAGFSRLASDESEKEQEKEKGAGGGVGGVQVHERKHGLGSDGDAFKDIFTWVCAEEEASVGGVEPQREEERGKVEGGPKRQETGGGDQPRGDECRRVLGGGIGSAAEGYDWIAQPWSIERVRF